MKLSSFRLRFVCCRTYGALLALIAMFTTVSIARADFVLDLDVNGILWNRPTTSGGPATFQAWETFSSVNGPNSPQLVQGTGAGLGSTMSSGVANLNLGFGGAAGVMWPSVNTAGIPNAFNSNPAAVTNSFLTSGGNIYSPEAIVSPRIIIPNNIDGIVGNQLGGTTNFVFQVRTIGLPDLNSFRLTDPVGGTPLVPVAPIVQLGTLSFSNGFGTSTYYDHLVRFQAAGNADVYQIDFTAAATSLSLDRIAVDTFYSPSSVPEPTSLAMFGIASLAVAYRRRIKS